MHSATPEPEATGATKTVNKDAISANAKEKETSESHA